MENIFKYAGISISIITEDSKPDRIAIEYGDAGVVHTITEHGIVPQIIIKSLKHLIDKKEYTKKEANNYAEALFNQGISSGYIEGSKDYDITIWVEDKDTKEILTGEYKSWCKTAIKELVGKLNKFK